MGDPLFDMIFGSGEGACRLTWEVGTRCTCYSDDTKQPAWGCELCGGFGVQYADPVEIRALFRGQSRWTSHQPSGEHGVGEAQLTTRTLHKPGYTDERVRDRYTLIDAVGDLAPGRIYYPAAQAIPFVMARVQEAWRVQLQGMDQATRVKAQP